MEYFLLKRASTAFSRLCLRATLTLLILFCLGEAVLEPAFAAGPPLARDHVPATARSQPLGRVAPATRVDSTISLPLRHQAELAARLDAIYDPASSDYHHYVSAEEFTEQFAPTEEDYQAVLNFARARGLSVTSTHANRTLVNLSGSAAEMERTFHVKLLEYQHPSESRTFYAPDTTPSLDLSIPILAVRGLDNYHIPKPLLSTTPSTSRPATPRTGSGTGGAYFGKDFRGAYARGVQATGTGQSVGLFELDAFYKRDVTNYEAKAGITAVPLSIVTLNGFNSSSPGTNNDEVALDIEMAAAMAPGLSSIIVYEGLDSDTILNRMAIDNKAKQLSSSWGIQTDVVTEQIFQQFAAQGQSFFQAAGDSGAFNGGVEQPSDNPYITIVGGTELATTGPAGAWASEVAWPGGSGGVSTVFPIPWWQQGISMAANKGSTTKRNSPDVAMVAYNVNVYANNGSVLDGGGTSVAAPLWAAYTALVNEQAASSGLPPVGFLNPAIYAIGKSTLYSSAFHDVTSGNNENAGSPAKFSAVAGYDLCTGWGSPRESAFITTLLAPPSDPFVVSPNLGFIASGPAGGALNVSSQKFTLTNIGSTTLNWSLATDSSWLLASPSSGTLDPGAPAQTLTVQIGPAAASTLLGTLNANVWFTNQTTGIAQVRQFSLVRGNAGFENDSLTDWTLTGTSATSYNHVAATDDNFYGVQVIPGVDDQIFIHSGIYGLALGENGSLSHLSQSIPTVAGQIYDLSFWVDNIAYQGATTPNVFQATWNGSLLFNSSNLPAFSWTNMHYRVSATGTRTVLEFSSRNDPGAFGLDDISLQAYPVLAFQSVSATGSVITLTWASMPGAGYEVQTTPSLFPATWATVATVTASSSSSSATQPVSSTSQGFYRVVLSP